MKIEDLIGKHKEVTVKVNIEGTDIEYTRKMYINWDSRSNPRDRIVGWDRRGNAVFIMIDEGKK